MEEIILEELNCCMELCMNLEHAFQQDVDEISFSVTGEVCDVYTVSAMRAMESVRELKQQIMLLHRRFQAPL